MKKLAMLCLLLLFGSAAISQHRAVVPLSLKLAANEQPNQLIHAYFKLSAPLSPSWLRRHGVQIKFETRAYTAVAMPAAVLPLLDTLRSLVALHFEMSRGMTMLDQSMLSSGVSRIHANTAGLDGSLTGDGVIIGIIDAGLDLAHPDFKTADGRTRVIELWDQTMGFDATRTPVYGYGQVWDSAEINAGTCPHTDQAAFYGHGTNTTGIASGNGLGLNKLKGYAPDAELILVSSDFGSFSWTATVADAVHYIFDRAEALGKPCVINASLGSYGGAHDGRDAVSQTINEQLAEQSGRLFVCAAGNAGQQTPFHLGYSAGADTTFTWFKTPTGATAGSAYLFFVIYGEVGDFEHLQFAIGADKVSGGYGFRGQVDFDSIENRLYLNYSEDLISTNGNFLCNVQTWADSADGTYRLEIYLDEIDSVNYNYRLMVTGSGRLDCWSGSLTGTAAMLSSSLPTATVYPPMAYYRAPDSLQTMVGYWACSPSVVTVGNFVNRTSYVNYDNQITTMSGLTSGAIAPSSSAGPTRLGLVKPDLAAPGEVTLTAGAAFQIASQLAIPAQRDRVASGGLHHRAGGTSSASPVVAGVGALLLQKCPAATMSDFIGALHAASTADASTGATPNALWGYGKLNAVGTIEHTLPAPRLATFDATLCQGESVVLTLDSAHSQVVWSNGDTGMMAHVNVTDAVYATVTNELGCQVRSDTAAIVVYPTPAEPLLNHVGHLALCRGESVELKVTQAYHHYEWSTGSLTSNIWVNEQGEVAVRGFNSFGCSAASDTLSVTEIETEVQFHLVHRADSHLAANVTGDSVVAFRWLLNGAEMVGETDSLLLVRQQGYYSAQALDTAGCWHTSGELLVQALGENWLSNVKPLQWQNAQVQSHKPLGNWQLWNGSGMLVRRGEEPSAGLYPFHTSDPTGLYLFRNSTGTLKILWLQ